MLTSSINHSQSPYPSLLEELLFIGHYPDTRRYDPICDVKLAYPGRPWELPEYPHDIQQQLLFLVVESGIAGQLLHIPHKELKVRDFKGDVVDCSVG